MMSSLQNLCEVPAAVVFSNHPDIKKVIFSASITTLKFPVQYKIWNNELQSVISETLNNDYIAVFKWTIIRHLIPFIGMEMLKWAEIIQSHFYLPVKFIQHFIKSSLFTSKGQIDEEKAARELLKESRLSIFLQYEIACHFFIQDTAQTLWQQFYDKENTFKNSLNNHCSKRPVALWSKYFEEINKSSITESELKNISQDFTVDAFSYGISNGNVAAIKFSFRPKSSDKKFDINEVDGNVKRLLATYLHEQQCDFSNKVLISNDFSVYQCISNHLFSVIEKEDRSTFLNNSNLVYNFLKCFLIWPHQNLFIKTAIEGFNVLMEKHFYNLLHDIVDMCEGSYLSETCNYRLLLREFWIKSPSKLKKYVINAESDGDPYDSYRINFLLLSKILNPRNFSPDDEYNFQLILESATLQERDKILLYLVDDILIGMRCIKNLKLGQFYAKLLNLNEDILKLFKERYSFSLFSFLDLEEDECDLDNVSQFLKCLFSPEEINNLKNNNFPAIFRRYFVNHSLLISWRSVEYFLKVCKWFGKTDQEIEEWKINGVFEEILSIALPTVVKRLFRNKKLDDKFYDKLLFLCSNNKERVNEYIKELNVSCKQYAEEKNCAFCWDKNYVLFENIESRYICRRHPESVIPTSETADEVCSSLLKHLHNLISKEQVKNNRKF